MSYIIVCRGTPDVVLVDARNEHDVVAGSGAEEGLVALCAAREETGQSQRLEVTYRCGNRHVTNEPEMHTFPILFKY